MPAEGFSSVGVKTTAKVSLVTYCKKHNIGVSEFIDGARIFFEKHNATPLDSIETLDTRLSKLNTSIVTNTNRQIAFVKKNEELYGRPTMELVRAIYDIVADGIIKKELISGPATPAKTEEPVTMPTPATGNSGIITDKDKEIFELKRAEKDLRTDIIHLISKMEFQTMTGGKKRIILDISQGEYDKYRNKYQRI